MAISLNLTNTKAGTFTGDNSGTVLNALSGANFVAGDVGRLVYITSGDGINQWRRIVGFNSATSVDINAPWSQGAFRGLNAQDGNPITDVEPLANDTFSLSLSMTEVLAADIAANPDVNGEPSPNRTFILADGQYNLGAAGAGNVTLAAGVCIHVTEEAIRGNQLGTRLFSLGDNDSAWVFGNLQHPANDGDLPYTFGGATLLELGTAQDIPGTTSSNVQMYGSTYSNANRGSADDDRVFWRLYSGDPPALVGETYQHRIFDCVFRGNWGSRIQGQKSVIHSVTFLNNENTLGSFSAASNSAGFFGAIGNITGRLGRQLVYNFFANSGSVRISGASGQDLSSSFVFANDTAESTGNLGYTLEVQGNTAEYADNGDYRFIRKNTASTELSTSKVSATQPVNITMVDVAAENLDSDDAALMSYVNYEDVLTGGVAGTGVKDGVAGATYTGPVETNVVPVAGVVPEQTFVNENIYLVPNTTGTFSFGDSNNTANQFFNNHAYLLQSWGTNQVVNTTYDLNDALTLTQTMLPDTSIGRTLAQVRGLSTLDNVSDIYRYGRLVKIAQPFLPTLLRADLTANNFFGLNNTGALTASPNITDVEFITGSGGPDTGASTFRANNPAGGSTSATNQDLPAGARYIAFYDPDIGGAGALRFLNPATDPFAGTETVSVLISPTSGGGGTATTVSGTLDGTVRTPADFNGEGAVDIRPITQGAALNALGTAESGPTADTNRVWFTDAQIQIWDAATVPMTGGLGSPIDATPNNATAANNLFGYDDGTPQELSVQVGTGSNFLVGDINFGSTVNVTIPRQTIIGGISCGTLSHAFVSGDTIANTTEALDFTIELPDGDFTIMNADISNLVINGPTTGSANVTTVNTTGTPLVSATVQVSTESVVTVQFPSSANNLLPINNVLRAQGRVIASQAIVDGQVAPSETPVWDNDNKTMTFRFSLPAEQEIVFAYTYPGYTIINGSGASNLTIALEPNVDFGIDITGAPAAFISAVTAVTALDSLNLTVPNTATTFNSDTSKRVFREIYQTDTVMDFFAQGLLNPADYEFSPTGLIFSNATVAYIIKTTGDNEVAFQTQVVDALGNNLSAGSSNPLIAITTDNVRTSVRFNTEANIFQVPPSVFTAVHNAVVESMTAEFDSAL